MFYLAGPIALGIEQSLEPELAEDSEEVALIDASGGDSLLNKIWGAPSQSIGSGPGQ
jgi:hypothetical protein